MNPGTWIMGGGGAGGGAGAGNGNGKNGAGGAGGPNDGEGGPGNGNGAGSCGQGGAGACTNCASKTSAGDPIDVVTGEVFTGWKTDLFLPGFFALDLRRKYTTAARHRDVGFGHGWLCSLAWEIQESGSGLVLLTGGGFRVDLPAITLVGDQISYRGWALLKTQTGFLLRAGDEFLHTFEPRPEDPTIHRLVSVRFRDRGELTLSYDRGVLAVVTDTAGRQIVFERGADGRVARLLVPEPGGPTTVFARYLYDARGDLVQITDGDGHVTRHAYDDAHRLIRTEHPTRLVFHFVYDERGRGVETWGVYDEGGGLADPALADDVPAFLADGTTPAKGIHHVRLTFFDDGTSEAVDSVRFHRFFGSTTHPGTIIKGVDSKGGVTTRTLDDAGSEIAHEDPLGAVWTWDYDALGEVVRATDPEGHTVRFDRDGEGRLLRVVDAAGNTTTVGRDHAGEVVWVQDQRGGVAQQKRNSRGLTTELVDRRGGVVRVAYDAFGNVVEETGARGSITRHRYDYLGRLLATTLPRGGTESYRYDVRGNLLERVDVLGRRQRWDYDGLGHIVVHTRADGESIRVLRGGNGWPHTMRFPGGESVRWRYNREGWLVALVNEKDEPYRFTYDADGLLEAEQGFDDVRRTYTRDARGRPVAITEGDGRTTEIARNLLGQPIAETLPDGSVWRYHYDVCGRVIRAEGPSVAVAFLRDPAGDVIQETCDFDGAHYRVESALDAEGLRIGYQTSLGHSAGLQRDAAGNVERIWTNGSACVAFERDENGTPTRTTLAGGGVVRELWDDADRLVERRVERPAGIAASNVPAWVGGDGNVSTAWRLGYDALSEVTSVASSRDGLVTYHYDLRRRLRSKEIAGVVDETFFGDAAGNTVPLRGTPPVVERGNRLVWSDRAAYRFDLRGFVCEKHETDTGAVTRYVWGERDLLARIELPDGGVVAFAYDPSARRVRKTVSRIVGDGSEEPIRTTHYVWDGHAIRHAITFEADGTQHTRTFVCEDTSFVTPLAHYDEGGPLRYYVTQLTGAPEQLVDGGGTIVGSLTHDAYGRVLVREGESTEIRAAGQLEDPETGLFYNRYRYYDPAIGRYLSPDPIGLAGGENLYTYCPNPIAWVDPLGWRHHITVEGDGTDPSIMETLKGQLKSKTNPESKFNKEGDNPKNIGIDSGGGGSAKKCSETNLMDALKGTDLEGKNMTVTGQFPPCNVCHLAMQKFAKENGMGEVKYKWKGNGGDNEIVYKGDGSPPAISGPAAKPKSEGGSGLADRYKLKPGTEAKGQDPAFDDPAAADAAYKHGQGKSKKMDPAGNPDPPKPKDE